MLLGAAARVVSRTRRCPGWSTAPSAPRGLWERGCAGCATGAGPEASPTRPRPLACGRASLASLLPSVPALGGARRAQRSGDWLPRPCPVLIGGSAGPAGLAGSKSSRGRAARQWRQSCAPSTVRSGPGASMRDGV